MAKIKTTKDEKWLKDLGENIKIAILKCGFKSPYEFWINTKIGDCITRAGLNRIITGQSDTKITTLKHIAKALKVNICDLLPKS